MTEFSGLSTALILGLLSMAHCVAMCGTVIGALTLSLPTQIRTDKRKMLPYIAYYNLGRILSYATAGGLVGLLSSPLASINGHAVLRYLSFAVMLGMGLYLAGWLPSFARIERAGTPIWRWLQPIGQKFVPIKNWRQAFFLGMVWGWLPCGLVYAGLAVAATSGGPTQGALVMLAFGIGTLPAVMGAGLFTGLIASMARAKYFRKVAGLLIIVTAMIAFWWPMEHMVHAADGDQNPHAQHHSAHMHHK